MHRRFTVDGPDRLWRSDMTEHLPEKGIYCAAELDAYSRRIIGWPPGERQTTGLVTDALGMAMLRRSRNPNQRFCVPITARKFRS